MGENTLGNRIEQSSFPFNSCHNVKKDEGKSNEVLPNQKIHPYN